jgi:hypothetical protein
MVMVRLLLKETKPSEKYKSKEGGAMPKIFASLSVYFLRPLKRQPVSLQ